MKMLRKPRKIAHRSACERDNFMSLNSWYGQSTTKFQRYYSFTNSRLTNYSWLIEHQFRERRNRADLPSRSPFSLQEKGAGGMRSPPRGPTPHGYLASARNHDQRAKKIHGSNSSAFTTSR